MVRSVVVAMTVLMCACVSSPPFPNVAVKQHELPDADLANHRSYRWRTIPQHCPTEQSQDDLGAELHHLLNKALRARGIVENSYTGVIDVIATAGCNQSVVQQSHPELVGKVTIPANAIAVALIDHQSQQLMWYATVSHAIAYQQGSLDMGRLNAAIERLFSHYNRPILNEHYRPRGGL